MENFINYSIQVENIREFRVLRSEILKEKVYDLPINNITRIIDIGSHVGLSVLYFRDRYPEATIIAFEPHPKLFSLLRTNIESNQVSKVELHQAAIGPYDGKGLLYSDLTQYEWLSNSSMLKNGWNGLLSTEPLEVVVERLTGHLDEPVDILKIDSEGYEWQILRSIEDKLHMIGSIVLEFHGQGSGKLKKISRLLNSRFPTLKYEQDGLPLQLDKLDPDNLLIIKAYELDEEQDR